MQDESGHAINPIRIGFMIRSIGGTSYERERGAMSAKPEALIRPMKDSGPLPDFHIQIGS
jgi:hypothetical protein